MYFSQFGLIQLIMSAESQRFALSDTLFRPSRPTVLRFSTLISTVSLALLFVLSAVDGFAQSSTISGKITFAGNKLLKTAHVRVFKLGSTKPEATFKASESGGYSATIDGKGTYRLVYTGVNAYPSEVVLVAEKALREEINVELAPISMPTQTDSVLLTDQASGFNVYGAAKMKVKDGDYIGKAQSRDTAYKFQIYVLSAQQSLVNMQPVFPDECSSFDFDKQGKYIGIISTSKEQIIRFDPATLLRPAKPVIRCGNPALQRQVDIYTEMMNFRKAYQDSLDIAMKLSEKQTGSTQGFDNESFNSRMNVSALRESLIQRASENTDEFARQLCYLYYLSTPGRMMDNSTLERILREIPPGSPLWGIDPQLMYVALSAKQRDAKEMYANDVLSSNTDIGVIATVAYNELLQATIINDNARAKEMYTILTSKCKDHPLTYAAKSYFNPTRSTRTGAKLPSFSVATLDKGKITNDQLKGKFTLIDCWATSNCPDCDNTIKVLSTLQEKYKGKNFQILSIAMDGSADVVKSYRAKNSMNWLHGVADKGLSGELASSFDITGLPTTLLVGPDLTILASGFELRGSALMTTITNTLSEKMK
jgi:thiol-disulfide isomerase/thioredoxin